VQPVSLKLCPRIQGRPEPPLPTVHRLSSRDGVGKQAAGIFTESQQ
jgi:hypothetical protein